MQQLPLDLGFMPAQGRDDFIISDCNKLAAEWIDRWPDWPGQFPVLNIVGPAASGKSHLAAIWRARSGRKLNIRTLSPSCITSLLRRTGSRNSSVMPAA